MSARNQIRLSSPVVDADGTARCRNKKCQRVLGKVQLGVLVIGGVILWNEAQYSCARCGTAYRYQERDPEGVSNRSLSAVSGVVGESRQRLVYATLNSLGT